jgi:MFS family permease
LGVQYAFLLGGVGGLVGLLLGAGIREKRPAIAEAPTWASLLKIARDKQLVHDSWLAVIVQFIRFASTFGFTPIIAVQLGATPLQLGLLGVTATLPGLVVSPLSGAVFIRKPGARASLVIGFTMLGAACMIIPHATQLWQLFAVQVLCSVGASGVFTILMGLSIRDISSEKRATAMGFFQAVYGLGMFLGPMAVGWLGYSFGLPFAFGVVGAVGIITAAFVAFASARLKANSA